MHELSIVILAICFLGTYALYQLDHRTSFILALSETSIDRIIDVVKEVEFVELQETIVQPHFEGEAVADLGFTRVPAIMVNYELTEPAHA